MAGTKHYFIFIHLELNWYINLGGKKRFERIWAAQFVIRQAEANKN